MNNQATEIGDISAELEAIAALLLMVGTPFQDGSNTFSSEAVGCALYGIQRYVERLKDDLDMIEDATK